MTFVLYDVIKHRDSFLRDIAMLGRHPLWGVVLEVDDDGGLRVRWSDADCDSWIDAAAVEPY